VTRAYFFVLGALVGAAAALTACADLERRLDQFFGAGDGRLYVMEDM
jgi:hypothetical protein